MTWRPSYLRPAHFSLWLLACRSVTPQHLTDARLHRIKIDKARHRCGELRELLALVETQSNRSGNAESLSRELLLIIPCGATLK